jgi:hypothetical protein
VPDSIGDPRRSHPIPLRLRNPLIPQDEGGALGWRGPGWDKARRKALRRARGYSEVSGESARDVRLTIDHVLPYRLGVTQHTNRHVNLRATDEVNNPAVDAARGYQMVKRPKRRMRTF